MSIHIFDHEKDLQHYSAGQVIFSQGAEGHTMFAVITGEVEIILDDKVIEAVGAGSIIGEMALIDSQPRSATARAKTDCQLAEVDENRFKFMVQQTPFFALQVMRILVERLRHMQNLGVDYLR